jgi:hypothetical protein
VGRRADDAADQPPHRLAVFNNQYVHRSLPSLLRDGADYGGQGGV